MTDQPRRPLVSPKRWQVCFAAHSDIWWVQRLVPGRFKHVRAFGFVPIEQVWVFVDVTLGGVTVQAARDGTNSADWLIHEFIKDCEVLSVEARRSTGVPVGGWCVPSIRRLLGIPGGALLPDRLWRDCLRHGAVPLDEVSRPDTATDAGRAAA